MKNKIQFALGKCYEVIKSDGTRVTFKVYGGDPPLVMLSNGEKTPLHDALGAYLDCYQIDCSNNNA
ncbi:MAG: hypothetical protein JWQ79_1859 [Mucilaginibacter sp.]|nr:hypothetical protein [Mucilaginibacter sp.]